jgi:hypothetical protein
MTNMTLAIPEDLYKIMKKHSEIKWSEVARQAIWTQVRKLELMDNLLSKSEFTEKDALILGRKIKQGIAKQHSLVK